MKFIRLMTIMLLGALALSSMSACSTSDEEAVWSPNAKLAVYVEKIDGKCAIGAQTFHVPRGTDPRVQVELYVVKDVEDCKQVTVSVRPTRYDGAGPLLLHAGDVVNHQVADGKIRVTTSSTGAFALYVGSTESDYRIIVDPATDDAEAPAAVTG